jgi:hypothetical protein
MKRTLMFGSLWTASAAAAVGLGFLAVSLVDASATPGTVPTAATAAAQRVTDDSSAQTSPAAAPTGPAAASGEQLTAGGTVYASCADGQPVLASAPAPGWWVDDSSRPGQVEFKDGGQSIEVHVGCATGAPRFSVEGPRADDGGRDSGSSAAPSAGGSARPTVDDSTGRVGGGHGADDGPSAAPSAGGSARPTVDDSSGRVGGGHGADDGAGDDSSGRRGGGHGSDG